MSTSNQPAVKRRRRNQNLMLAGLLLAAFFGMLVYVDLSFIMPIQKLDKPNFNNDLSVFWTGAKTIWQGGNPYTYGPDALFNHIAQEAGGEADVFLSPFYLSLFFMPLALFPLNIAALLWLVLSQLLLGFAVGMVIRAAGQTLTPGTFLTGLGLALLWRACFEVMILNNLSLVMLFAIVASYHFSRTGKPFAAGAFAALLLLKPQITFLTLPLLLVMPSPDKSGEENPAVGWLNKFTYRRWLGFGAVCVVYAIYSFAVFPGWVGDWLKITAGRNTAQFDLEMTSVRSLAANLTGDSKMVQPIYYVMAGILGLGWLIFWWLNRNNGRDFPYILSITIGVNLLAAPYTRSYDFCMLVFPLLYGFFILRQREKETIKTGRKPFRWSFLWWGLLIPPYILKEIALHSGNFAWENMTTLMIIVVIALVWRKETSSARN
jgi:hypothetical protein